jgi:hypothetical protein
VIFASAPEPVDGVAPVWLENGSGALAELLPAEARDLAADLLAAAHFAENGWGCLSELAVPERLAAPQARADVSGGLWRVSPTGCEEEV